MTQSPRTRRLAGLVLAWGVALSSPASAGIFVQIEPETTVVDASDQFSIDVFVPVAGDEFDAYETVIDWDPALLQLDGVSQGSLMTNACGNNWFQTEPTDSSLFISHAFLCGGGLVVTGPGPVSTLTFTAIQDGTSSVAFDYIHFFKGGILNPDVTSQDGVVTIGGSSNAPQDGGLFNLRVPTLEVFPNPVDRSATIEFRMPRERTASLALFDVRGRRLHDLVTGRRVAAGTHRIRWSPSDAAVPLAGGVYYWRLRSEDGRVAVGKMILER